MPYYDVSLENVEFTLAQVLKALEQTINKRSLDPKF